MSHWEYNNEPIHELPEEVFGFVYLITNLTNNKKYIGRKQRSKTVSKPRKNKDGTKSLRKQKVVTESTWATYTGSSISLNQDINKLGKDNFKFEILGYAYTKGQLAYLEENIQHRLGVIFKGNEYYNDSVGSRRFMNVKTDERFLKVLKDIQI
jgi:hypothetical protein